MSCTITINLNYKNLPSESINRTHAHMLVERKTEEEEEEDVGTVCMIVMFDPFVSCVVAESFSQPVSQSAMCHS